MIFFSSEVLELIWVGKKVSYKHSHAICLYKEINALWEKTKIFMMNGLYLC